MRQNKWENPGEDKNNNERSADKSRERGNYEGFEGMNYEQRRQPFTPQPAHDKGNTGNQRTQHLPEE